MKTYFLLLCTLISAAAFAQKAKPAMIKEPAAIVFGHDAWTGLLRKYVKDGNVDYSGFYKDKTALMFYTKSLSAHIPTDKTPKNDAIAYWINAYNAFTVQLIVDNYGIKSIKDVDKGEPWKRKWIVLGTKTYSLDQIENDILRPKYKDARIHFAINCGAKSCPPLRNEAFEGSRLSQQLDEQAKGFINNPVNNTLTPSNVMLSKIFDWFKTDFKDTIAFLNKYSRIKINATAKISYNDYDWSLNGK